MDKQEKNRPEVNPQPDKSFVKDDKPPIPEMQTKNNKKSER